MPQARRFSVIIGALALGIGVAAAPAAARGVPFRISSYNVTYEGSGSYGVKQVDGPSHAEITARFHWKVHYLLTFIDQKGHQLAAATSKPSSGAGDWSIASDNGGGDTCSKTGRLSLNKFGTISGRVQPGGKVIMRLVPGNADFKTLEGSSGSSACDTTDFWHDWVLSFSKVGNGSETVDPLTAFATLSKKDLTFGKVVVNVSNHTLAEPSLTVASDCGSGHGASCTQSYDWKGSVTFKKVKRGS